MNSGLKKIMYILSWIVLPGLMFFFFYLINQESVCFFIMGTSPGTVSIVVALAVLIVLYLIFRNFELTTIAFLSSLLAFIVTAGIGFFFGIGRDVSVPWILIYGLNLFLGTTVLFSFHHGGRGIKWSSSACFQLACLVLLVAGFLLLAITDNRTGRFIGLALTGVASMLLYTVYFQRIAYERLFSKRIERGAKPLTFLQIIQTLWTYFILVLGSGLLGLFGLLVYALLFLDIEHRKLIFHYMVMYYSRFFIWIIPMRARLINETQEKFIKPAVLISNHQSLIDTTLMFRLCPKAIILTNDWVYNSPIFGHISKLADFYNVSAGIDRVFEKLRGRVEKGYSIIVFPEGTRSRSKKIQRFHRGAFYIAEKLEMDILPILFCGTDEVLKKDEFWGKSYSIIQKIFPRIKITDSNFGENYSKRAKQVRQYLTKEYEQLKEECHSSSFQR